MPHNFLSYANRIKEIVETANSQQLIFFKRKKNLCADCGYREAWVSGYFERDSRTEKRLWREGVYG